MVAAPGVAVQRVGVVLLQLVIKPAPAEQRPALFLGIFPLHLPEQKGAELGPEAEVPHIIAAERGGAAQQPVQPRAGLRVAADRSGHFQIEALEGGQLQKKAAQGQIEAPVNGGIEIGKDLPKYPGRQLRAEGPSVGKTARRDGHAQRIAAGLPQNGAQLALRRRDAAQRKHPADVLPVKAQIVGLQNGHQAGVLKGRQRAGGRAPGKQHEAPLRLGADQLAERLRVLLLLQLLQIVQKKDVPIPRKGGEGKARVCGAAPQDALPGKQSVGQRALSKAAGRAEKEDPAMGQKALEALPDGRLDHNGLRHGHPPFSRFFTDTFIIQKISKK